MKPDEVTDEMLMAAVDGELDDAQRREIERVAAQNPRVAARMSAFVRSRDVVVNSFAGVLAEPVPDRLVAAAAGKRTSMGRAVPVWQYAVAASLAVIAGAAGWIAHGIMLSPETDLLARVSDPRLAAVISTAPAGSELAVEFEGDVITARTVATYQVSDGYCRLHLLRAEGGSVRLLACTDGRTFQPVLTIAEPPEGSYRVADDPAASAIDTYLDAAGAGHALSLDEEAELIARDWRD